MILDDIYKVILARQATPLPDSYVTSLLSEGKDKILKKIGEEAVEVIIASKTGEKAQIIHELSDLWFHCLVLMVQEGVDNSDIWNELQNRFGKRPSK